LEGEEWGKGIFSKGIYLSNRRKREMTPGTREVRESRCRRVSEYCGQKLAGKVEFAKRTPRLKENGQ
jgi:hypothetical protein